MKKLFVLFALFALIISASAQERTVNITVPAGDTYYKYTGTTSDVLIPTTTDTIDLVFWFRVDDYIEKVAVKSRFDMRTTADTTVAITVMGKEFSDDATYVDVIASSLSGAVTANNTVAIDVSDPYDVESQYVTGRVTGGDTVNVAHNITPFDKSYRYYKVRYILQGNDATGTGVNIDEVEIKLYTR